MHSLDTGNGVPFSLLVSACHVTGTCELFWCITPSPEPCPGTLLQCGSIPTPQALRLRLVWDVHQKWEGERNLPQTRSRSFQGQEEEASCDDGGQGQVPEPWGSCPQSCAAGLPFCTVCGLSLPSLHPSFPVLAQELSIPQGSRSLRYPLTVILKACLEPTLWPGPCTQLGDSTTSP